MKRSQAGSRTGRRRDNMSEMKGPIRKPAEQLGGTRREQRERERERKRDSKERGTREPSGTGILAFNSLIVFKRS